MSYDLFLIPGNRPNLRRLISGNAKALPVSGVLANGHTLYRPQDNAYRIVDSVSNFIRLQMNGEQPSAIMLMGFDIMNVIPMRYELENYIRPLSLSFNLHDVATGSPIYRTHGLTKIAFCCCFHRLTNSGHGLNDQQSEYINWFANILSVPRHSVGRCGYFEHSESLVF